MSLVYIYKTRGITKDITVQDGAGATITPGTNDKIRAIIGREGKLGVNLVDAQFSVTSDAATANGSSFTKNSPSSGLNRLRLDASDLDKISAGVYTLFVDFFDNADGQEWKNVSREVVCVEDT